MNEKEKGALKKGAEHCIDKGDFNGAANYYRQAGKNNKVKAALEQGAEHCIDKGDFNGAANYYRQAGMNDKEKWALKKGAEHCIDKGDFNGAANYYRQAGKNNKVKAALEQGAEYCIKKGDFNGAANYYRQAGMNDKEKKIKSLRNEGNPSLEKRVHLVGIGAAFICSLIFLSGGITGNLILNSSVKASNVLGAVLFIVGVVASFLYTQRR